MSITQVRTHGVKGVYADWKPSPLTLITGQNGAGKTARLLSLPYALHGYTNQGKTLEATASLSPNGEGMSVGVELADGFSWTRAVKRDAKGSYAQELRISGRESLPLTQAAAALQDRVGTFTAALNLAEFTSLKADGRRQFILELCGRAGGSSDAADYMAHLEFALLAEMLGPEQVNLYAQATYQSAPGELDPSQRRECCEKLWPTVDARIRAEWDRMRPRIEQELDSDAIATVQKWVELAKELKSAHKAGRDGAIAAAGRISEDKNRSGVISDHPETIRRNIAEKQNRLADVNRAIGSAEQRTAGIERARQLADSAQARLNACRSRYETAAAELKGTDWEGKLRALRQQLESAETCDTSPFEDAVALARDELDALSHEADEAAKHLHALNTQQMHAQTGLDGQQKELARLQASDWVRAAELVERLRGIVDEDLPDATDAMIALQEIVQRNSAQDQEAIELVQIELISLQSAIDDNARLIADAQARADALDAKQELARKDHEEAVQALARAQASGQQGRTVQAEMDMVQRRWDSATNEAERLHKELSRLESEHREAAGHVEAALGAESVNVEELVAQRDTMRGEIRELEDLLRQKDRMAALDRELAECLARSESEKVALELAGCLQDAVKAVRETLLVDLVRPLLGRIDRYLSAAGVPCRCYCDLANERGKATFELGWVKTTEAGTERKVSLDTLSGGEASLFGAALAYALVMLADPPLKVLTVEADTLDEVNLGRLLDGFSAIGADLDHVLVATSRPIRSAPPSWELMELGREQNAKPAGRKAAVKLKV